MAILSDRDQVQLEIADGGWDILWGDMINELDAITFLASVPTGTTAAWAAEQVEVQLQKFAQSSADVSGDVLDQAALILEGIALGKWLGKWDINGLEVKGGIATYHRWLKFGFVRFHLGFKKRLVNNYQPYIGLRVAQPLPLKGSPAAPKQVHQTDPVVGKAKP